MKIDVCIPTWNSDVFLERCLKSVYCEIDVNKIFILDKYSTDGTLKIINNFNKIHDNIEIIQDNGNLAIARQKLIEKVTTDFFLFIDADVELKSGISMNFINMLDDNVGAVAYPVELTGRCIDEKYVLAIEKIGIKYSDPRGFTYCTFIRVKSVDGITIPPERYAFEDQFICDYIRQNGFRWLIPEKKLAIHYNDHGNWLDQLKFKVNSGRLSRKFSKKSVKKQTKSFFGVIIYSGIASVIYLDPRIFIYMVISNILLLYGYYTTKGPYTYQDRDALKKISK